MALYDFTLYDVIARNARLCGGKCAWIDSHDGREFNFSQIRQMTDSLAAALGARGISKGDRIGVVAQNCAAYFLVYGAAAALGAIVLPVNWRLSEEEVQYCLNDCSPKCVFADGDYRHLVKNMASKLSSVEHLLALDQGDSEFTPFDALLAEGRGKILPSVSNSDDGLVIIHTAAVAGNPRGALLSHRNVLLAGMHLLNCMGVDHRDVHLNLLPMFHVAGLFMAVHVFMAGGLNVNMKKFDAPRAVELIESHQASVMFDFTPILNSLLEAGRKNSSGSLDSLQKVIGIDTPQTIEQYQKLTGGTFFCMYGQTETSALATMAPYDLCPGSAGRPIPMAVVEVVDDQDEPVDTGQVGEIVMRGPMVFKGYWNLPEDNKTTFRNNWHHTGDLGRFDENGFLWYEGRKPEKELIKPGGENVYPAEVEKAILEHPAVRQTVVFGVPDPKWKEGIKAVCVLEDGSPLTPEELIEFVGSRIARYKKPQYVEFVTNLPATAAGQIDRAKVKELYGGPQS